LISTFFLNYVRCCFAMVLCKEKHINVLSILHSMTDNWFLLVIITVLP
jgi:hypothetical protein